MSEKVNLGRLLTIPDKIMTKIKKQKQSVNFLLFLILGRELFFFKWKPFLFKFAHKAKHKKFFF